MARRYKKQIVVMCKEDLADWVKEQATQADQSNAAATRAMLEESRRVRNVAEATGYSVEDILRQVEALAQPAAAPSR